MDAAYLEGIARPRLQAEADAFKGVPTVGIKPDAKTPTKKTKNKEAKLWDEIDGIMKAGR